MRISLFAGAAALVAATGMAQAAYTWANNVEDFDQGSNRSSGSVDSNRSNPLLALGAPQNNNTINFVSLGKGGSLVLSFGTLFHNEVVVWETTYPPIGNHLENAAVYVGYGADAASANFYFAGNVANTADGGTLSLANAHLASGLSAFKYVKLVDITNFNSSASGDGFDVDAVGVTAIPTPGSIGLAGAGGLLLLRRRRAR